MDVVLRAERGGRWPSARCTTCAPAGPGPHGGVLCPFPPAELTAAHFGGGGGLLPKKAQQQGQEAEKPKSRRELIEELIARSKQEKVRRRRRPRRAAPLSRDVSSPCVFRPSLTSGFHEGIRFEWECQAPLKFRQAGAPGGFLWFWWGGWGGSKGFCLFGSLSGVTKHGFFADSELLRASQGLAL